MKRYYHFVREDPVWSKIIEFSLIIFFIRLGDAIISFWAPNLIQASFNNNPVAMGLVISFQSVVGLLADLVFPSLLKKVTVKNLIVLGIFMSLLTILFLLFASTRPLVILFLISMSVWGIYYELNGFAEAEFVSKEVPRENHSASWGIITVFKALAYFIGPLFAAWLLIRGNVVVSVVVIVLLLVTLLLFTYKNKMVNKSIEPSFEKIEPITEIKYWLTLSKVIWPLILMTLFSGFLDSTFWTTGAVWTEKLTRIDPLGSLFLPIYTAPSLFIGFVVAKKNLTSGKKKWSQIFLLIGGLFLFLMILHDSVPWIILMVLLSSIATAVSFPLLDGVYADIAARLGKERKHVIGLIASIVNISYIIWPPIAGVITKMKGERLTFIYMGIILVVISGVLIIVTPKKLRLPETEISKWK